MTRTQTAWAKKATLRCLEGFGCSYVVRVTRRVWGSERKHQKHMGLTNMPVMVVFVSLLGLTACTGRR